MPSKIIEFSQAKNGEKTCSCEGKFLHSKYNPSAEAQKFVQNIQAEFEPCCIFIIEPALSYCSIFLKEKFPKTEIFAIRFTSDFDETNKNWNKTFYFSENLSNEIFNFLGEEKVCSSLFIDWTASRNSFLEESNETWRAIKDVVIKSRNVMATREYFSKRWTKNFAIFSNNISKIANIKSIEKPILIAASGTSLKSSIEFIKKFRENFFLIAVSSAFMPLLENEIKPDFVISTDGGYWAKKHLEFPKSKNFETIFAIATEAALPKSILKNNAIIPLLYDDCAIFQKKILERIGIKTISARRNGTVSGTALELALSLTKNYIFFCGLDQAPSKEFQHTQPNALEFNSEQSDFRFNTKETRMTTSRFNSEVSLEIYRNWFISNSKKFNYPKERVFRLSDNFNFPFKLGEIKDINWCDFENFLKTSPQKKEEISIESKEISENRKKIIVEELKNSINDEKSLSEFFPMDCLLIKRETNEEKKNLLKRELSLKVKNFILEIEEKI